MRTLTFAGAALAALALATPAAADHGGRNERTLGAFAQTNLVIDATDADLVNPWGRTLEKLSSHPLRSRKRPTSSRNSSTVG